MHILRSIASNAKILSSFGVLVCLVLLSSFSFATTETITYTYDDTGALNTAVFGSGATVQYAYDGSGNRLSQTVSGSQPGPVISLWPMSLNFAPTAIGSVSAPQNITIINTGTGSLEIESIGISGTNAAEFPKQSDNCSGTVLAPDGTCTVGVVFSPAAPAAPEAATLQIVSNAPSSPTVSVSLSGGSVQCSYAINPDSSAMPYTGGEGIVAVSAIAGCGWSASSNSSLLAITSGASGSGNGWVYYSVAANNTTTALTGTATIAGLTLTVTQAGIPCTYSISPMSQSFGASGGTGSVSVTTLDSCAWSVTNNMSWASITSGANGSGSGIVNYTVAPNNSVLALTGSMTIAGLTLTVTQAGIPCTYSISPMSQSFGVSGGIGSISVTTSGSCTWSTTNNTSWASITSGANGSGSGTVNYMVMPNNALPSRTGSISIAGIAYQISQLGETLGSNFQTFGSQGSGSGQFNAPEGVALDNVNNKLYIADNANDRIVEMDSGGGNTTLGGNFQTFGSEGSGSGQLNTPEGVSPDIHIIPPPPSTGEFNAPVGVALDSVNNKLYIADSSNSRIVEMDSGGGSTTLGGNFQSFGSQGSGYGQFGYPGYITLDSANNKLYITDRFNSCIVEMDSGGNGTTLGGNFQTFGNQSSGSGQFGYPVGISLDSVNSKLYISDCGVNSIVEMDSGGNGTTFGGNFQTFGSQGSGIGQFNCPGGLFLDGNSNKLYIADGNNYRIVEMDSGGNGTTFGGNFQTFGSQGSGNGQFGYPADICFDSVSNNLYITDVDNNSVVEMDSGDFTNVSAQVSVQSTGFAYSRLSKKFTGSLIVTNNGAAISGTVDVALSNLTPGVTLINAVDTYNGAPYITASTSGLAAGASITVPVQFSDPTNAIINFTPVTYQE